MKKTSNQNRIVINIHQLEPLETSWVIIDDTKSIKNTVIRGDLSILTDTYSEYSIHVIIPGEDVVLLQAELPALSGERLLQALPYTLEDKLIDDVLHLHFAISDVDIQGVTSVAVINKTKLDMYLQILHSFGIKPQTIIPTMLALAWEKNQWHVSCHDQTSYVRTEAYGGFACDTSNLSIFLHSLLSETTEKPHGILVENISTQSFHFQMDSALVQVMHVSEKDWLEKIATLFNKNPHINLLQGQYRSSVKSIKAKKIWKWTSILAAAWVVVLLAKQLTTFFILYHAKNISEQEISELYHKQFPTAVSVIAPRERMESALKKASSNSNKNNFLNFLSIWANTLSNTTDIHMLSFVYQENQLNVAVSAKSFDTLDRFINDLTKKGLKVKQQNATVVGSEVKANVLILKA